MGKTESKLRDANLGIVSREAWRAREAFHWDNLELPVNLVQFMATHNIRFPWWDFGKAGFILRDLQQFHMYQRLMPDVQYNFLIDEHGTIYEGRGWSRKPSFTPGDRNPNLNSLYVAYIGENLVEEGPTDRQMKAGNDLISFGLRHRLVRYHHHIAGMMMGIVGSPEEECRYQCKKKKAEVKPVAPVVNMLDPWGSPV